MTVVSRTATNDRRAPASRQQNRRQHYGHRVLMTMKTLTASICQKQGADTDRSEQFTRYRSRTRSSTPGRRAEPTQHKLQCVFCRRPDHLSADCDLVTSPQARQKVITAENLCRRCFAKGHRTTTCNQPLCALCGRDHHESLCQSRGRADRQQSPWRGRARYPTPIPRRSASRSSNAYRSQSRSPSANRRYPSREVSFREPDRVPMRSRSPRPVGRRRSLSNSRQNSITATMLNPGVTPETDEPSRSDFEPFDYSVVNSSTSLPVDPRLMVVTSRSTNMNTRQDEVLVMLLDSGAQHSFIREDTAKRLGLRFSEPCPFTTRGFGGHVSTEMSSLVTIVIHDQVNASMRLRLRTRKVTTTIRANAHILHESGRSSRWVRPNASESSNQEEEVDVDILIGIDYYWSIVDPARIRRLPSGLTYVHTRFGPTLSGQQRYRSPSSIIANVSLANVVLATTQHAADFDLRRLWDLESLGIHDDPSTEHDDEVNRQVVKHVARWNELVDGIEGYRCSVPRFIVHKDADSEHELLIFADASKHAFAAVAYLLSRSGDNVQSHLLMAKARVAPLDEVTIPRLELMACLSAVLLAQFLYKELKTPIKTIRFFSDSHIALYWIHSSRPLKTFVANRVKKIRTLLPPFHYINTDLNPADCATRGLSAREISEHIWWKGPPHICLPPSQWPDSEVDFAVLPSSVLETDLEYKETTVISNPSHVSILPLAHTSHYDRLVRITAYVLRFLRSTVYDKVSSETRKRIDEFLPLFEFRTISRQQIRTAELVLLREHQREAVHSTRQDIYRDSFGIIRVNTRMRQEQSSSQNHPILLMPNHPFTAMIITSWHCKLHHAGANHITATLRPLFFMPRMHRTVKSFNTLRPIDLISPYFHVGYFTATSRQSPFYVYDLSDSLTKEALRESYDTLVTALDHFWKLWREDYLQTLAQRQQKLAKNAPGSKARPAVGDLVVVKTEDMPRAHWPLAVITRLHVSKDGHTRSAQIRTAKNTLLDRSIKHLIPLEIHVEKELTAESSSPTPTRTQPPRRVKRAKRH
ncbi:Pao retrotransposon peptidase [Ostertagia ostertagi]